MTTPDGAAAALRVLAGDVDRLAGKVDGLVRTSDATAEQAEAAKESAASAHRAIVQLSQGVKALTDQVRAVSAGRTPADTAAEEPPEPRLYWLTIEDAEQARDELADLIEWVGAVYGQFPRGGLSHCWTWHPAVVTELHSLRAAWLDALDGTTGSATKVMDWHDRHRVGVAARIGRELDGCSLSDHTGQGTRAYRPPTVPGTDLAGDVAEWWARTHGTQAAPPPTAGMLADEQAHLSAQTQARY